MSFSHSAIPVAFPEGMWDLIGTFGQAGGSVPSSQV